MRTDPAGSNGHDRDPREPAAGDELELLDANQIAELFKLRPDYVRRRARASRKKTGSTRKLPPPIPSIKIGHFRRFQEHAVRQWLEGLKENYPNHFPSGKRNH